MLKVMAATAAGAAAASAGGLEKAFAAGGVPRATDPNSPWTSSPVLRAPIKGVRTPLATNLSSLNYMGAHFRPIDSTFTFTGAVASGSAAGGTQAVAGPSTFTFYTVPVNLPTGTVLMQVLFDIVVNDANAANLFLGIYNPETGAYGPTGGAGGPYTIQSASIQTVDLSIGPVTIDAINYAYDLIWWPGTNGPTHQILGARIAWMLAPGLTLFPDPRRIVDGFLTPFSSGTTYGPIDAKIKSGGVTPSGVPAGAKAAFCAVQSYTEGALTIFPDGGVDPGSANYTATTTGPLNLTYMMVPLSTAGKFKIHSYISGRCFVDVWGFAV
jgi:hypothetical protein